ncbi:MAG: FtsB family cell division protein [Myxococcales bacterium]
MSSRTLTLVAGLAAAALAVLSVSDARGLGRVARLRKEVDSLEQKNRELEQANAALRREIEALSGDPRAVERAAREDLGYVKPNEVVFSFE